MRNSRAKSNGIDDKVPDMTAVGAIGGSPNDRMGAKHEGFYNSGMYRIKADFGTTLIIPHTLDRSSMYGKEEEECGRNLNGDVDNIAHSLDGAKVARAAVTGPDRGGTKSTTIKPSTR